MKLIRDRSSLKKRRQGRRYRSLIILIPVLIGLLTLYYMFGNQVLASLGNMANRRLVTDGWQSAQAELNNSRPGYQRQPFSYYQLQFGQDLAWAAKHFSVDLEELKSLNLGDIIAGITIKIPPPQKPLDPLPISSSLNTLLVATRPGGVISVSNRFSSPQVVVDIPTLAKFLNSYNAISDLGNKVYRLNVPLYLEDNIRLQISGDTVSKLELKSGPNYDIVALTFKDSEALIKDTQITSADPTSGRTDTNFSDGRSFVRAYQNGRMDVLNSTISYLGMTLAQIRDPQINQRLPYIVQGAIYGISWRIRTGAYGEQIVTGWVENTNFDHNYIGAYTFGAQGMTWDGNRFQNNDLYGLDPHDDSNNAIITNNLFINNGKHGFIISKRCKYNLISNNVSVNNKGHGFMLHADSDYNLVKDNISIGNIDNFVVYASSFNTLLNNRSYNPSGSHVRINAGDNQGSYQNYIEGNQFLGGPRGVLLHNTAQGVLISSNSFQRVGTQLQTKDNVGRVLYVNNQTDKIGYNIRDGNRVVFGPNQLNTKIQIDTSPLDKDYQ